MRIVVNGTAQDGASTVAELLERRLGTSEPRGVAVAVDAEVVPRQEWRHRGLRDGAVVEIVTAVQGG